MIHLNKHGSMFLKQKIWLCIAATALLVSGLILVIVAITPDVYAADYVQSTKTNFPRPGVPKLPQSAIENFLDRAEFRGVSPDNTMTQLYRNGAVVPKGQHSTETGFKYIIKKEQSGTIDTLRLYAYHTSKTRAENATYEMDIIRKNIVNSTRTLKMCELVRGNNLTFKVNTIRARTAVSSGSVCSREAITFPARGTAQLQTGTGLWRNSIEIQLAGGNSNHVDNRVMFKMRNRGSGSVNFGQIKDAESQEFGIVESYRQDRKAEYYSTGVAIPFGRPCADESANNGTIEFYDVDAHLFGPLYAIVYQQNRENGGEWTIAEDWRQFNSGDGARQSFRVGGYSKENQYVLIVDSPHRNTEQYSQTANVMGYSLPDDSIWGQVDCTEPKTYMLSPYVSLSDQTTVRGGRISVSPNISNESNIDAGSHNWKVTSFKYNPNQDAPNNVNPEGIADVCALYSGSYDCADANFYGIDSHSFGPNGELPSTSKPYDVPPDTPLGTKICFVTSVQTPTPAEEGGWGHSEAECVVVGVKPKLQVWGNDLKVLGDVETSVVNYDGKEYGSWTEYAAMINGINKTTQGLGMGSGNGLLEGSSGSLSARNRLTFANTTLNQFGGFGGQQIPDIQPGVSSIASRTLGTASYDIGDVQVYNFRGKGTITINGNQTYSSVNGGGFDSISDIPRVLIFADEVIINQNVTRIDPWIIAGKINTCGQATANGSEFSFDDMQLNANKCNNRLTFNGPVIVDELYAHRTTSQTGNEDVPGEVFNLRPDAFLSSLAGSGTNEPVATTDYVKDLPPRF